MRKRTILVAVILLSLLLPFAIVVPGYGSTQSTYDTDNKYPSGGIFAVDLGDPQKFLGCSGTLISPTVFLTAGHCTIWMTLPEYSQFAEQIYVSFDWQIDQSESNPHPNHWIKAEKLYVHPLYGHDVGNLYDLAVITLPEGSTQGIAPATLAREGFLDDLKMQGSLRDEEFLTVGYGIQADWEKGPPQFFWERWGWRNFATAPLASLTPVNLYLNINENAHPGSGGGCFGDSGGAVYLPQAGQNILVGLNSLRSDHNCRAMTSYYRTDTPWAQEFLNPFLQESE